MLSALTQRCQHNGGGKNKKSREVGNVRRLQRAMHLDSLPQRESMRGFNRIGRYPEVRFEPFMHFLENHKGQAWDKVYSKIRPILKEIEKLGVNLDWFFWNKVAINTYLHQEEIIIIDGEGAHKKLKNYKWFYVHPKTRCLMSKRHKPQKGPYPKKAKWKLEKEKAKKQRKFGKKPMKKQHIYKLDRVCTRNQILLNDRVYDMELVHGLERKAFAYRIRLSEIKKTHNGLVFIVKVLKSRSNTIQRGDILKLEENERRSYWNMGYSSFTKWKIYEAGDLIL